MPNVTHAQARKLSCRATIGKKKRHFVSGCVTYSLLYRQLEKFRCNIVETTNILN
jgi:hypothetical protein